MTRSRPIVAVFDVDGTLTSRDCVTPFLFRTVRLRAALALVRNPGDVLGAVAHRDRDRLKEVVCTAFTGMDASALDAAGETFAREIERRWLRDDTVTRLRRHRELGHRVVLASASLEPYLVPFGRNLGVEGVVCTRLERNEQGLLTGRLVGANCRGPEKSRRLEVWLTDNGLADATLWAYGDSAGDDELLARADHPVRVGKTRLDSEPL